MKEKLPSPPLSLTYEDVSVRFLRPTEGDPERGFVPGLHFGIYNAADVEVGHLNLRFGDTPHVRLAAGQIGFFVREPHRGNGFARKACLAVGPWISEVLGTVWITADPGNHSSLATLERIGAVFVDEVDVPEEDPHFARGSIRKRRYRWTPVPPNH